MNISTTIQRVNEAIKAGATADKLQSLSLQLRKQSFEARTRQAAISPDGLERRNIAQSGDISALQSKRLINPALVQPPRI